MVVFAATPRAPPLMQASFTASLASMPIGCMPCGRLQDKTVVVVTSGANMNFDRLQLVSELADIGGLREAMLATSIPESPGSFRAFIDTALSDSSQSVTEFKYRYSPSFLLPDAEWSWLAPGFFEGVQQQMRLDVWKGWHAACYL